MFKSVKCEHRYLFQRKSVLVLAAFLLVGHAAAAKGKRAEFRITDLEGKVAVIPKGAKKASPAVMDLTLLPGDTVVTGQGGRVEIAAKEGTVLELKEKSLFEVESLSDAVRVFHLKVGRLMSRFRKYLKKKKRPSYKVKTPIAVASVRGTDLALDMSEEGELQAGVVEGEVEFGPLEEAGYEEKELWEETVLVEDDAGIQIKPGQAPQPMPEIPPILVGDLEWFDHIRKRIPKLREEWKDLSPPSQQKLRETAFRDTIQWEIPPHMDVPKTIPQKTAPPKLDIKDLR